MTILHDGKPVRVVPVEATEGMRDAAMRARAAQDLRRYDPCSHGEQAVGAYVAMLAASPTAPSTDLVELVRALAGMLQHSCVADAAPIDKDAEDHDAERAAREALAKWKVEDDDR